jgi:hypothetical protein
MTPPSQPSPARGEGVKVPAPTFIRQVGGIKALEPAFPYQGGRGKGPCTNLHPQLGKEGRR